MGSPEGIGHGAVHPDLGLPSYHKAIMPRFARVPFRSSSDDTGPVNYEDIACDIVERTLANLQAVDRLPPDGQSSFYDVTHLINSLLGLIVVPNETMRDQLPTRALDQLQAEGWELEVRHGTTLGPSDLRAMIRGMRNAVAHFRLEFAADDQTREITSVTLWSTDRAGRVCLWGVRFTPSQLHSFVKRLAMVLLEARRPPASTA